MFFVGTNKMTNSNIKYFTNISVNTHFYMFYFDFYNQQNTLQITDLFNVLLYKY